MKSEEQRRKNKLLGWTIAIIAIAVYVIAVYFGAGKG